MAENEKTDLEKLLDETKVPGFLQDVAKEMLVSPAENNRRYPTSLALETLIKKHYQDLDIGDEDDTDCASSKACLKLFVEDAGPDFATIRKRFNDAESFNTYMGKYYSALKKLIIATTKNGIRNGAITSELSVFNGIIKGIYGKPDEESRLPYHIFLDSSVNGQYMSVVRRLISLNKVERAEYDRIARRRTDLLVQELTAMNLGVYRTRAFKMLEDARDDSNPLKLRIISYTACIQISLGMRKTATIYSELKTWDEFAEGEPDKPPAFIGDLQGKRFEKLESIDAEKLNTLTTDWLMVQYGVLKDKQKVNDMSLHVGKRDKMNERTLAKPSCVWNNKKMKLIISEYHDLIKQAGHGDLLKSTDTKKIGAYLNSYYWHQITTKYFPEIAEKYDRLGLEYGSHVYRSIYVTWANHQLASGDHVMFNGRIQNPSYIQSLLLGHEDTGTILKYQNFVVREGERPELESLLGKDAGKMFVELLEKIEIQETRMDEQRNDLRELMNWKNEQTAKEEAAERRNRQRRNKRARDSDGEEQEDGMVAEDRPIEKIHAAKKGKKMNLAEHVDRYNKSVEYLTNIDRKITDKNLKATGLGSGTIKEAKQHMRSSEMEDEEEKKE